MATHLFDELGVTPAPPRGLLLNAEVSGEPTARWNLQIRPV